MQRKVQGAERFDRKTDADGAGELTDFIFSAGFTDSNLLKYGGTAQSSPYPASSTTAARIRPS